MEISVANPIEKFVLDKNMILPDVPCGHFALGTLSETCFKDAVFDVNVRRQKVTKFSNIEKRQI